jgi:hypothetical protein
VLCLQYSQNEPIPFPAVPGVLRNLSVNNIYAQQHLAERDDGSGQVVECEEATLELLLVSCPVINWHK